MYRRVFAFDFDGTLAQNGTVPPALQAALRQLRAAGYALFVVTARQLDAIAFGPLKDVFDGIVWENGAVLYHAAGDEVYLPFGQLDACLVEALEAAGVPLEQGQAIASAPILYNEAVWEVLSRRSGDVAVSYNKGSVMLSPPGAAIGPGLERLLEICGFSPRNLVSFGDGENDLSLLQLGEIGVAVADAVPFLKDVADLVTSQPGPAGVLEALEAHWLRRATPAAPTAWRRERPISLGKDETGATVSLPGTALAGGNLGVFGDSGSGKSWVIGLLAEGMHRAGYQVVVIDPEGDHRGMRALPRVVAFAGDLRTLPPPNTIVALLEKTSISAVLDLSAYPIDQREHYVVDLLCALRSLKESKFRPHWIVLEEAQHFLPPYDTEVSSALLPMLAEGGWAFVSYRPDGLASPVLAALDYSLLTRLSEPEAVRTLGRWLNDIEDFPAAMPQGYAWLCGQGLVRLRSGIRRVPHIRHLYKYLDAPLPPHKRFCFRDEQSFLGLEAASLFELLQQLPHLPLESLAYHQARDDFAAWAANALGDETLAAQLHKLARRPFEGEALREALAQCVATHCAELRAQR